MNLSDVVGNYADLAAGHPLGMHHSMDHACNSHHHVEEEDDDDDGNKEEEGHHNTGHKSG
jgi:hypothetical protein